MIDARHYLRRRGGREGAYHARVTNDAPADDLRKHTAARVCSHTARVASLLYYTLWGGTPAPGGGGAGGGGCWGGRGRRRGVQSA